MQFKIHGTVWHTPVFCFTPSLLQPYKYEAICKRDAPTHPGIHTEWRSLIFRRVQNWYKLFSLENNSASKKGEEGRQAPEPQPEAGGTRKSVMEQNPFPKKRKKREEGRQAPEPTSERRGTSKSEQNPFSEKRKKREEGRQAPEPQPEPGGASKSWGNKGRF